MPEMANVAVGPVSAPKNPILMPPCDSAGFSPPHAAARASAQAAANRIARFMRRFYVAAAG